MAQLANKVRHGTVCTSISRQQAQAGKKTWLKRGGSENGVKEKRKRSKEKGKKTKQNKNVRKCATGSAKVA